LWLRGHGAEEDRPDKSLMLVDTNRGIENACECKPLAPGHAQTEQAAATVLRICRSSGRVGLVSDFYESKLVSVVGRPL